MDRDRNLLFGVFAVQLKKVTPSQLMEAAGAWAVDPAQDLGERLVISRALSEADHRLLQNLVGEAIRAHSGDATAAMEAFGGVAQVNQSFHGAVQLKDGGLAPAGLGSPSSAAVLEADEVPAVQESPGRYSHVSEHARGGMGRILLVHDHHLGRDVALKELLPDLAPTVGDSPEPSPVRLSVPLMGRFLQEACITGQLEHPSIVPVYELGYRRDGSLYYTMKLVRGRSLSKAIGEAGSFEARIRLLPRFADLCQAIAYAHSRGVIHRDLKPSNVMVGEFGETVVLDWGLAKANGRADVHTDALAETLRAMNIGDERDVAQTAYGQVLGTPAYMPPEQARGLIDQVDERSDVYSLGAILYEMLTGRAPFSGDNVSDILNQVLLDAPARVTTLAPGAPRELAAICDKAMHKERDKRYETASSLAADIERFQSGALVQAYSYKTFERVRRFVQRHRYQALAAATATFGLLFLLAYLGLGLFHAVGGLRVLKETDIRRCSGAFAAEAAFLSSCAESLAAERLSVEDLISIPGGSDGRSDALLPLLGQLADCLLELDSHGQMVRCVALEQTPVSEHELAQFPDDDGALAALTRQPRDAAHQGIVLLDGSPFLVACALVPPEEETPAFPGAWIGLARRIDRALLDSMSRSTGVAATIWRTDDTNLQPEQREALATLRQDLALLNTQAVDAPAPRKPWWRIDGAANLQPNQRDVLWSYLPRGPRRYHLGALRDVSFSYALLFDVSGEPVLLLGALTETDTLFNFYRSLRWALIVILTATTAIVVVGGSTAALVASRRNTRKRSAEIKAGNTRGD